MHPRNRTPSFVLSVLTVGLLIHGNVAALADEGLNDHFQPAAVISFAGYNRLAHDIDRIGGLLDKPQWRQQVEGLLAFVTGGQGLNGLNKEKPWGVAVQHAAGRVELVAFVPVDDFSSLIGVLTPLAQGRISSEENGVYRIKAQQRDLFVTARDGFAFVVQDAQQISRLPTNPLALLGDLPTRYGLAVRVNAQAVPQKLRDRALQGLRPGFEQNFARHRGESDSDYEIRRAWGEAQIDNFETLLQDLDQITLGWKLDEQTRDTILDVSVTAVPGGKLASQVAEFKHRPSRFSGFTIPDSTFALNTNCSSGSQEDVDQVIQLFELFRSKAMSAIDEDQELPDAAAREHFKSSVSTLIDVAEETLQEGNVELGSSIRFVNGVLSGVVALHVSDGNRVDNAISEILRLGEQYAQFPSVQWNFLTHNGVRCHKLTVTRPTDSGPTSIDLLFGFASDAIYLALGDGADELVRNSLDRSTAGASQSLPPFQFSATIGHLLNATELRHDWPARDWQQLAGNDDKLTVTGEGIPQGVRYQIRLESGVIKAIGKLASQRQLRNFKALGEITSGVGRQQPRAGFGDR